MKSGPGQNNDMYQHSTKTVLVSPCKPTHTKPLDKTLQIRSDHQHSSNKTCCFKSRILICLVLKGPDTRLTLDWDCREPTLCAHEETLMVNILCRANDRPMLASGGPQLIWHQMLAGFSAKWEAAVGENDWLGLHILYKHPCSSRECIPYSLRDTHTSS